MKRQIEINGKTYEVDYDIDENSSSAPFEPAQSLVLPTPPLPGSSGQADINESKVCRSPVAGIVARVNVEAGQFVQTGEMIVVIEAMKMENNLTAPAPAKVKSVAVKVGGTVKAGQIVVQFE